MNYFLKNWSCNLSFLCNELFFEKLVLQCVHFTLRRTILEYAETKSWDRRYDHNFLRFLTIFGEKIGVFIKNQCYDELFSKFSFVLSQKRQFFAEFFSENI
jgi:hypothetical protein